MINHPSWMNHDPRPHHYLPIRSDEQLPLSLPPNRLQGHWTHHSLSYQNMVKPATNSLLSHNDEEEDSILEHHFDIKTTEGKTASMKGAIREKVSLVIGNHIFRKRRTANGSVFFSCNGGETSCNKYLSAIAKMERSLLQYQ